MGRNCGNIALYSGLAGGAEYILVPEEEVDINKMCRKIVQGKNRGKLHSLIIRAEGVKLGTLELAEIIEQRTGLETREVVLGYTQMRRLSYSQGCNLASLMGYRAVELLLADSESRAIGIRGGEIIDMDLSEALEMKRTWDPSIMNLADILSI